MHLSRRISTLIILTLFLAGCQSAAPSRTPTAAPAPTGTQWPTHNWSSAAPAAEGMDPAVLAQAVAAVKDEKINLYSLLVIRNGVIVSENYFQGDTADTRRDMYSVTKSFIGTLIGIAIDKGLIHSVDLPLLSFFPKEHFNNLDARKQAITLDNMLTMNSGLDWTESDASYSALYASADWVKAVLDEPMRAQPGTKFNYCSGCSHVLSAVLQQQTGAYADSFATAYLLYPLGITAPVWETDSQGIPIGGWGLQLTPRDMAKLGYLYLNNGQWEGKQIVSAAWVKTATQKHSDTDSNLGYGYQWWIYPKYGAYAALGRYGQTIFVVPSKNLIIVTTANIAAGHDAIFKLIDTYIVPAVKN